MKRLEREELMIGYASYKKIVVRTGVALRRLSTISQQHDPDDSGEGEVESERRVDEREVYVLMVDVDYNDWFVLGVFSTLKRAKESPSVSEVAGWLPEQQGLWWSFRIDDHTGHTLTGDYKIERYVVDDERE